MQMIIMMMMKIVIMITIMIIITFTGMKRCFLYLLCNF